MDCWVASGGLNQSGLFKDSVRIISAHTVSGHVMILEFTELYLVSDGSQSGTALVSPCVAFRKP